MIFAYALHCVALTLLATVYLGSIAAAGIFVIVRDDGEVGK